MKSQCVIIQMDATEQYFHVVVFVCQSFENANFQKLSEITLILCYTESLK